MVGDASVYPKTYRYSGAYRAMRAVTALVFTGLGVGLLFVPDFDWRFKCLCIAFPLPFWAIALPCFYMFIRLETDALVFQGRFRRQRIARSDIVQTQNGSRTGKVVQFQLLLRNRRRVTISNFGSTDEAFWNWFKGIRSLDFEAYEKKREDDLSNPAFGRTPEERARNRVRHGRWLGNLGLLSLAVAFWGVIAPFPRDICVGVLIALPVLNLVIVALSGHRYALWPEPGKIEVADLICMGCLALLWRAWRDIHLVSVWTAVAWAIAIGVAFSVAAIKVSGGFRRGLVSVIILAFGYGYGAAVELNWLCDDGISVAQSYTVTGKSYDPDRKLDLYKLALATVNRHHERKPLSVSVRRALYEATPVGGRVCLYFYTGPLRIQAYRVAACPAAHPDHAPTPMPPAQ